MPQITVTLDEMTYMDLVHNLPKGMKSAFVNRAVKRAIHAVCGGFGGAMHAYARDGESAAHDKVTWEVARIQETQTRMSDFDKKHGIGEEE